MQSMVLVIVQLAAVVIANAAVERHIFTVYFDVNRSALNRGDILSAIRKEGSAEALVLTSRGEVSITGFTDCAGDAAFNLRLSEKRARAVAFLWKNMTGKDPSVVKGVGEEGCDLLETGYDADLRRVEIAFEMELFEVVSPPPPPPIVASETRPGTDFKSAASAEVGAILPITGLNFIGGKHFPLTRSYEVLAELVRIMKENPTLVIEIQGHVCCGNIPTEDGMDVDTGENKLSENRARFVYDHLIKNGIAAERMTYRGFAETRPLPITLEDPGLESLNRRVEIMIVSK